MSYTFGVQLYSLKDYTDYSLSLRTIVDNGCKNVEFYTTYGLDGKEMKRILDDLGMKGISAHVGFIDDFNSDAFKKQVEFNHQVGNEHIVLPGYAFPTIEEAKRSIDRIGKMMEMFKREGFSFGYHNHAHEFKLFEDGTCPMDYVVRINGIKLQPDVFWLKTAGVDPVEFLKKHSDKLISVHLKEYGENGRNIEFGNGILPWREIMDVAEKAGAPIGIIEQEEYSVDPLDSIKTCLKNLNTIFN